MRVSVIGLGKTCLAIRNKTKWSQSNLAAKLKITQMTVSRWEDAPDTEVLRVSTSVLPRITTILVALHIANEIKTV